MKYLKRFARNEKGRDLIVGDVHGHFSRLQLALDRVAFDPAIDRLFSVGDLVDRGPECDQALDWLAKPWFHAVRGNHEDMAIRWPNGNMDARNYVANGGGWNVSNPPEMSREFSEAFAALPVAMELETVSGLVGIVHADCPFKTWQEFAEVLEADELSGSMKKAIFEVAMWSCDRIMAEASVDGVDGVRAVIVGHTPVQRMTSLGNVIYIDTGGWFPEHRTDGHFTILDAATLREASPHRIWEAAVQGRVG